MIPFLRQVAEAYVANEADRLDEICFVFPNKRSATFFMQYLTKALAGRPAIMPEVATLNDVVASISDLMEASRLDQLFTLFNEYRAINGNEQDFERFLFWGEMILSDFNDVDRDLVDASRLFVNLRRYREIQSDYLTDEQKEILTRYWGESFDAPEPGRFWSHINEESPSTAEHKFLKLWEVLALLYDRFTQALASRGTGTDGMMLRRAVGLLRRADTRLPHPRYVFVGFNVLSLGELRLFELLKLRGCADFYWDNAAPAFDIPGNRAAYFLRRNIRLFPSRYALTGDSGVSYPKVEVKGIPSAIGQTKEAGSILARWGREGAFNPADAINTAVVLPDEGLFIPMIHAVPSMNECMAATEGSQPQGGTLPLNVTMGLPMRATSLSSLVSLLVRMHIRAVHRPDESLFFFEDVKALVSHPLLLRLSDDGCARVLDLLTARRIYMLSSRLVEQTAPSLSPVFATLSGNDSHTRIETYFRNLFEWMLGLLSGPSSDTDAVPELPFGVPAQPSAAQSGSSVEAMFIAEWLAALSELSDSMNRYGVEMQSVSYVQLLEKALSGATARLEGEPLKGLQVMGVLETRALDFDNVIILSMNERVFPRKHFKRSFIPDNLRRAYGMASSDYQEAIYAYYFYRLISRASRVALLYDARNSSGRSSEPSRYISQMLYLFPELDITHTLDSFNLSFPPDSRLEVEKTDALADRIKSYTGPGKLALSASSINTFVNCPLSFYLRYLRGLNLDRYADDYMDASVTGSIFHAVMQEIYLSLRGDAPEVRIEKSTLEQVMKSHVWRQGIICRKVNELFNKLEGPGLDTPLAGEAKVMANLLDHYVLATLRCDSELTPFDFIEAEYPIDRVVELRPGLKLNVRQVIDRIDRIYPRGTMDEGVLRIVDYKTGTDSNRFTDMAQLFDNTLEDRRKAILQLFFYCNVYARTKGYDKAILPVIYNIKTMVTQGIEPLMFGVVEAGKKTPSYSPVDDYREHNDEFLDMLSATLGSLFDPSVPFVQAPTAHNCSFCSFRDICRRR